MQTLQKTWNFCRIQLTHSLKFSKSIPPHDSHDLNYVQRMLQAQYLTHPQEALEPQWRHPHQAPNVFPKFLACFDIDAYIYSKHIINNNEMTNFIKEQ